MVQRTFVPGGIANEQGDLYGTSPLRILRFGSVVVPRERAGVAIMMGWRAVEKSPPDVGPGEIAGGEGSDPDFAWLTRTAEERENF